MTTPVPALSTAFEAVLADRVSGSRTLALAALDAVRQAMQQRRDDEARAFLTRLRDAFPSMAVILNVAHALLRDELTPAAVEGLRAEMTGVAWLERALHNHLAQPATVLTFSNSGAVFELLLMAREHVQRVYCCRSLPGGEGEQAVRRLCGAGIAATLVEDAEASTALAGADIYLIGADMVCGEFVVNKVGSLSLALLCRHAGVPVLSVAGPLKRLDAGALRHYRLCGPFERVPVELLNVAE